MSACGRTNEQQESESATEAVPRRRGVPSVLRIRAADGVWILAPVAEGSTSQPFGGYWVSFNFHRGAV